ncbi:hypothetical protein T09_1198 [Trichinella sp. T9]|uniref:Uncharacterized protein n=1 Tax=Trichinella murrelli TaxID=144512 RepID=A0A0V0TA44_9BILA|nr:hypothetical protein T05_16154 [Trichinella murrelli]KRX54613.1 hypothetical protein T09_1198 [Trichinella sp. T9]KRZ86412.1 hypothetical protein T08_1349 [Trichinella sp. T8]
MFAICKIVNLRQNKPKHKVSGIILQRTKLVYGEIYCVSEIAALCSSCSMLLLLKLCFVLQILKKSHDH